MEQQSSSSSMVDAAVTALSRDPSLASSLALTRSWEGASTSGFIPDDADHWAIESYLPIDAKTLKKYLSRTSQNGEADDSDAASEGLQDAADDRLGLQRASLQLAWETIERHVGQFSAIQLRRFTHLYESHNPDADHLVPDLAGDKRVAEDDEIETNEATVEHCRSLLLRAGYELLDQSQIESCVGVASQWGVPLHVDFDLFEQLHVFTRGDIMGTRVRRRLRKLYRQELVEVPTYQRMIIIFELKDDSDLGEDYEPEYLHLRLFKNIPKQDVDMLLPGSKIKISGVDRVKIILPSLGGFLMSVRKIAQYALLFAVLALHWSAILIALIVGYLVKSFFSYFRTKNRYQLNLTRNLYFQKLDTNAGVGFHLVAQAANQMSAECVLAYSAIATHDEPISMRKLRRKCERLIREAIDLEIKFQVERAVAELEQMALVNSTDVGISVSSSRD